MVGSPGVSIYHNGSTELYITEGLVNRCPPEGRDGKYMGKLAAVLTFELSKMVVEATNQKSMRTVSTSAPSLREARCPATIPITPIWPNRRS